jgi:hypothetical protein
MEPIINQKQLISNKKGANNGNQTGKFIKDKVLRLVVPLVTMGMLIFGVLQIFLERLAHGEFRGSFLEFLPRYFDGLYGYGGNFAWSGLPSLTSRKHRQPDCRQSTSVGEEIKHDKQNRR